MDCLLARAVAQLHVHRHDGHAWTEQHVHIQAETSAHALTDTQLHTYIRNTNKCTRPCMQDHIHIHRRIHLHTHAHTNTCTCICICQGLRTYTRTCMYMRACTCMSKNINTTCRCSEVATVTMSQVSLDASNPRSMMCFSFCDRKCPAGWL